jgi:chromosome segregation ATPase
MRIKKTETGMTYKERVGREAPAHSREREAEPVAAKEDPFLHSVYTALKPQFERTSERMDKAVERVHQRIDEAARHHRDDISHLDKTFNSFREEAHAYFDHFSKAQLETVEKLDDLNKRQAETLKKLQETQGVLQAMKADTADLSEIRLNTKETSAQLAELNTLLTKLLSTRHG